MACQHLLFSKTKKSRNETTGAIAKSPWSFSCNCKPDTFNGDDIMVFRRCMVQVQKAAPATIRKTFKIICNLYQRAHHSRPSSTCRYDIYIYIYDHIYIIYTYEYIMYIMNRWIFIDRYINIKLYIGYDDVFHTNKCQLPCLPSG